SCRLFLVFSQFSRKCSSTTSRIGVNLKGKDGRKPYRFYVKGNPYVSGLRKREMNLEDYGWEG
ncbi:MAG: hypothetical protein ACFN0I_06890, partial [Limosilactobacillus vaginalis]